MYLGVLTDIYPQVYSFHRLHFSSKSEDEMGHMDFGTLLASIRAIEQEEERAERLAAEFAWEDYAEELTAAYWAQVDAEIEARNPLMVAALKRMEDEGVRDAINAKVVDLGGYKWVAA